jgi:hypothetical protein
MPVPFRKVNGKDDHGHCAKAREILEALALKMIGCSPELATVLGKAEDVNSGEVAQEKPLSGSIVGATCPRSLHLS